MKQDVAFNLACIGRFRADVAMLEPDAFAYDVHQVRPRGQGNHERGIRHRNRSVSNDFD